LPQPFLLIVAGPNGAGKTTLTRLLREQGVEFGEYINPDDIARKLEGSYERRVAQAQIIADERRDACIEAKRSFSFETVMSHPSKIDVLIRARAAGFLVQLFFVGTDDPQTNVERVGVRVADGGHDVPKDRIVARWHRTMGLLHQAIERSDRAFVFDNSPTRPFAGGPRLVFRRTSPAPGVVEVEQFAPIPDWVRAYVLEPLRVGPMPAKK
jgi:predicted ABC-type ATPase